jgi:uncharacterized protein (TIGR02145 family)
MKLNNIILLVSITLTSSIFGQRSKEPILNLSKGEKCCEEIVELDKNFIAASDTNKQLKQTIKDQNDQLSIISNELINIKENNNFIKIGEQYWMNKNLQITSLSDGTNLILAETKEIWDSCFNNKIPAYCYHLYDSLKQNGCLYNIHALNSGKLAPNNYLIPTLKDVQDLISYFGSAQSSASIFFKSKEKNTWKNAGLDIFGMNIKPSGFRLSDGFDWYFGDKIYLFCESNTKNVLTFFVFSDFSDKIYFLNRNKEIDNVNYGMYVRCLKSK